MDRCGKSRHPTGIRSPDHPSRRQSLYRLRYPAYTLFTYKARKIAVTFSPMKAAAIAGECLTAALELVRNLMAHGDAREGK